ncbi:hypothetical protein KO495_01170 [Colwellia sp. D2M02]|uniref:Stf0 family sulfotransferase n=1 Tax=Colwellia sp. D2M02 TaxID=2841562 RepID=UPI001C0900D7|nr:Stf0 family sulfotransferase [Colwellia sp. D2M02]MBU2891929.1 hypothetical protein [Colwellia sp. D2M02]
MLATDDVLLNLMVKLSKNDSVATSTIKNKVLILSTPRSGSSLFCDVLNNTAQIGECAEWFNERYINAYGRMTNTSNVKFDEYLNFILEKTVGNTGVFAVNAHIEHMFFLLNKNINLLKLGFTAVVYVSRKDKVAQAVSLEKSKLTDSWSSDVKPDTDKLAELNNAGIAQSLQYIIESDTAYQEKLADFTHAEFYYEDFCQLVTPNDYKKLFELLDIDYQGEFKTTMKKQRDGFSKETITSFKQYLLGS